MASGVISNPTNLVNYSLTPLNDCDLSNLYIRKDSNRMVYINGHVLIGKSVSQGAGLDLGTLPSELYPLNGSEVFSTGYCYDKYATALIWETAYKLQLFKASSALAKNDAVIINITYKARN